MSVELKWIDINIMLCGVGSWHHQSTGKRKEGERERNKTSGKKRKTHTEREREGEQELRRTINVNDIRKGIDVQSPSKL